MKDIQGRLARWLNFLSTHELEVLYRPGTRIKAADCHSQIMAEHPPTNDGDDRMCMITDEVTADSGSL